MGETKKGDVDRMRDKGPALPLIEPRHKRTKGGGLGWLLHEGKPEFEKMLHAMRDLGYKFDMETDHLILQKVGPMARNDKVELTTSMVRRARHRLGYKAFEKQPKPLDYARGEPVAAPAAGEAVSDVEIAAHETDVTGLPPSVQDVAPTGAPQSPVVKIEGQVIVSDKVVNPGRMTLLKGLRWDEEAMAEAIERLAAGMPPESRDQDVVMRAIKSQVEAVTMAASPKLHGMLSMFPDGMKEYLRCVFKVMEALGVEEQDPKVGCFGSWHRMNSSDCKGCKVGAECFSISFAAVAKQAEKIHKCDLEGKPAPTISIAPETCLEYRPNPDGVCAIVGCNLRKRTGMRCDLHGKIYMIGADVPVYPAVPAVQTVTEDPIIRETATAPVK